MCPLFSTHMGSLMCRGVSHATRVTVLWSLLVVLAAVRLVSRWVSDHALTADLYEGLPACQVHASDVTSARAFLLAGPCANNRV